MSSQNVLLAAGHVGTNIHRTYERHSQIGFTSSGYKNTPIVEEK